MGSMKNEVNVRGVVATEPVWEESFGDEGIYSCQLSIFRAGREDRVIIRVSDRFSLFSKVKVGADLEVVGVLRCVTRVVNGMKKSITSVFARSIAVYGSNGECGEYKNEIELEGTLCEKMFYREAVGKCPVICDRSLRVDQSHGRTSFIPVVYKGRNAEYIKNMQSGAFMRIRGVLRTRKYVKKSKGESREVDAVEVVAYFVTRKVPEKGILSSNA